MFAWLRIEELDQDPAPAAVSGYVVQLINQVTGRANSSRERRAIVAPVELSARAWHPLCGQ